MIRENSVKPPNNLWKELPITKTSGGCLTFFYSEDLSYLPIRWVTKPSDNKSDPNLETLTYGLFSTCGKQLRQSIVKHGSEYLFFITNLKKQGRCLVGFYKLKWFAASNSRANDYSIAAQQGHFVENPISLKFIDQIHGTNFSQAFRLFRRIPKEDCLILESTLLKQTNIIGKYLEEIDRLERFNEKHGKYRYIAWKQSEKFSWEYAKNYLDQPVYIAKALHTKNSTVDDTWECCKCHYEFKNRSLLKRCPNCGAINTVSSKNREVA